MGRPVRDNTPVQPNGCFNCGELGHYANICPKRNTQTPQGQRSNDQRNGQQSAQAQRNRGQQNVVRGRVNHMTAETAQEANDVVLGMFFINSEPASILFDSGASHSFITDEFVVKHNIPKRLMRNCLIVNSPSGEMKATFPCPRVPLEIMGIDFLADLVVLKTNAIDVILGMDWLGKHDGIIQCAKKSVLLTSPQGDRIEFGATSASKEEGIVKQMKETVVTRTQCTT